MPLSQARARHQPLASTPRRSEYVAAIRYPDGRRDKFHIHNADDLDDARALVISEVGDVGAVLIALRR